MKPKSVEIFIPGPAGRLEAKYYKNQKFGSPVAIVLQPHPQYGGTMNNKIVQLAYNIFLEGNIFNSFELYSGLDGLYSMFANEAFLLIFWIHFLALSLFLGAWIARDSQKYMIPKFLSIISLILTYFSGPVGLFIYWFIRIFFAKKISFND